MYLYCETTQLMKIPTALTLVRVVAVPVLTAGAFSYCTPALQTIDDESLLLERLRHAAWMTRAASAEGDAQNPGCD